MTIVDTRILEKHLQEAEEQVAEGERRVRQQECVVAEWERLGDGARVDEGKHSLVTLREAQEKLIATRDHLRAELEAVSSKRVD
jgi:hypothetical protein